MKKVIVAGSGILGSQIAFQVAFHNYQVVLYDLQDNFLEKAKQNIMLRFEDYKRDINAKQEQLDLAFSNISYSTVLQDAVQDADIVIEAIPEDIQIKKEFYAKLGGLAPEKTIFCTNTSTLLPSQFAAETGRPERFLATHFANLIWKYNVVEIMGHPGTDQIIFDEIVAFSKTIGMIPIPIHKEQPGYIMNTLYVNLALAAIDLLINGVADVEAIDKTWLLTPMGKLGTLASLDIFGLTTPYNICRINAELTGDEVWIKRRDFLKVNYIDKNKLGVATGEGFYKYPNPSFEREDFLKP